LMRATLIRPATLLRNTWPLVCARSALRTLSTKTAAPKPMSPIVGGIAGAGAGGLSALCGVGGGLLLIPLFKKYGGGMTAQQVGATAMFALTMGSGTGAATYINEGVANIPTAIAVFMGSATFSIAGARVASMLSGGLLNLIMKPVILLTIPLTLSKTDAFKQFMDRFELHERVPATMVRVANRSSRPLTRMA